MSHCLTRPRSDLGPSPTVEDGVRKTSEGRGKVSAIYINMNELIQSVCYEGINRH